MPKNTCIRPILEVAGTAGEMMSEAASVLLCDRKGVLWVGSVEITEGAWETARRATGSGGSQRQDWFFERVVDELIMQRMEAA